MQDSARQVTAKLTDRAQQVASDTREAMTVYSDSVRTFAEDLQAVRASSTTSVEAIVEVRSAWAEWLGKAVRANSEATQQLIQCKSVKQVAELQREFMTRAMHDWMESSTKVLQITQRASGQALHPLDERLSEVA